MSESTPVNAVPEANSSISDERSGAIPIPADVCLRIENVMLKKALKQRELQDLEQHEAEIQRHLMSEYGAGEHFAIDLARQCIIPNTVKPRA